LVPPEMIVELTLPFGFPHVLGVVDNAIAGEEELFTVTLALCTHPTASVTDTTYVPAKTLLMLVPVIPFDQLYVKGATPPLVTTTRAEPFALSQVLFTDDVLVIGAEVFDTFAIPELVHPLDDVTV
jgi:hypothetical protein